MRIKQIEYHLDRAAHFRAQAAIPRTRSDRHGTGLMGQAAYARRAAVHEGRAAELLAAGLREYAGRSQTKGAREQRLLRRRRGVDPRTAPDKRGRGRGRKDQHWGRNEEYSK